GGGGGGEGGRGGRGPGAGIEGFGAEVEDAHDDYGRTTADGNPTQSGASRSQHASKYHRRGGRGTRTRRQTSHRRTCSDRGRRLLERSGAQDPGDLFAVERLALQQRTSQ